MAELGSIMLDPEIRGRGLGRALTMTLLAVAIKAGARTAFLQVDVTNMIAERLYASLGFCKLYRYETLIRAV